MIGDKTEKESLGRLKRIEGQVKGIANMLKKRRYCIDIILQITAVEAALHKLSENIMRNHIETCVLTAFRSKDKADREAKIDELMQVYAKFRIK